MTRVRIEIERYAPKLKGMEGRNMRGADGRMLIIYENSIDDALAEIRALRNNGAFDAPYTFKEAKIYDNEKFLAWVATHGATMKDMPKPIKTVTEP